MYRSTSRLKSAKTFLSRTGCEGGCDAATVTGAPAPVPLVDCAQPNARRAGPTIPKSTRTLGLDLAAAPSRVAGHRGVMVMIYGDAGSALALYCFGQRH